MLTLNPSVSKDRKRKNAAAATSDDARGGISVIIASVMFSVCKVTY